MSQRIISRRFKVGAIGAVVMMTLSGCFHSSGGNGNTTPNGGNTDGNTNAASQPGSVRQSDRSRQFPLDTLPRSTLTIGDDTFRIWLALSPATQQEGLMFVPKEEIAADEGMLFVFPDERELSFWMRNTLTALDIAYASADGTIVKILQMPPLTTQTFPSDAPAMFALEVKQGTFAARGIEEGQRMVIPDDVFKHRP